jgi:hypothetical protein
MPSLPASQSLLPCQSPGNLQTRKNEAEKALWTRFQQILNIDSNRSIRTDET